MQAVRNVKQGFHLTDQVIPMVVHLILRSPEISVLSEFPQSSKTNLADLFILNNRLP